jgi:hypothetical protein
LLSIFGENLGLLEGIHPAQVRPGM